MSNAFVKWDCGCIGFHPSITILGPRYEKGKLEGEINQPLIVHRCEDQSHEFFFGPRQMAKEFEAFTFLSEDEQQKLIKDLNDFIQDGSKFRTIRALLKENHE